MLENLAEYQMIRIMFADFITKKSDYDVIDIVEKYLS